MRHLSHEYKLLIFKNQFFMRYLSYEKRDHGKRQS